MDKTHEKVAGRGYRTPQALKQSVPSAASAPSMVVAGTSSCAGRTTSHRPASSWAITKFLQCRGGGGSSGGGTMRRNGSARDAAARARAAANAHSSSCTNGYAYTGTLTVRASCTIASTGSGRCTPRLESSALQVRHR